MKPMGLTDPRTGRRPYAVVQLRQENLRADSYNLVGFQNHMRFAEQARVFRMIPGLGARRIPALRSDSPQHLYQRARAAGCRRCSCARAPTIFFAGQISGVEGYVESIATGLVAGRHAAELASGRSGSGLSRAKPPSDRCAPTSPAPIRATTSRPISPSICCRRWTKQRAPACGTTRKPAMPKSAAGRCEKLDEYRSVYA